ncbi:hypothetical protein KBB12_00085 [Candidatus Woesebacteria bacterium]|nr:hypothetical protein [Candidatus Woesebacteria bacterium]
MHIALFLHFYQPPTQKRDLVVRVAKESYIPVIRDLTRNPRGKITLNITGCLLSRLDQCGYSGLLNQIRQLVSKGRIELVGSSAYHAFLPKLPEAQIIHQIDLQEMLLRKYFGEKVSLKGFFPPEMAFVPKMAKIIQKKGYEWIILDSFSLERNRVYAPLFEDKNGMRYFFRNRPASYALVAEDMHTVKDFTIMVERLTKNKLYRVLGLDGETFGHHRPGHEELLAKIYKSEEIDMHTISELENLGLQKTTFKTRQSSWTILDSKRSTHQPFVRWNDPENEIHKMQWQLTELAIRTPHDAKSQRKLDSALFSCQYWWASARPWWQIEMIESGAHALLQAIIYSHATARHKQKAVDLYHKIVATAFDWMRSGKMQKRVNQEHEYMQVSGEKLRVNQ